MLGGVDTGVYCRSVATLRGSRVHLYGRRRVPRLVTFPPSGDVSQVSAELVLDKMQSSLLDLARAKFFHLGGMIWMSGCDMSRLNYLLYKFA